MRVQYLPEAIEDIQDVLAYTVIEFGYHQHARYSALIKEAVDQLESTPGMGIHRPDVHAEAWVLRIAQPGRKASHLLLYRRQLDATIVYGLLHDAMHLPSQWREREQSTPL